MTPQRMVLFKAALVLFCIIWADGALAEDSSTQPAFAYPASSDFLLIELTGTGTLMMEPEDHPFLRIYGDGRVHVRRPSFVRRDPGDHTAYLNHSDLQELLLLASRKGLLDFDRRAAKESYDSALRARRARTGSVPVDADAGYTVLSFWLAEYTPATGAKTIENFQKRLTWRGLSDVVVWYPELESLGRFQAFVELLESIENETIGAASRGEVSISIPKQGSTE